MDDLEKLSDTVIDLIKQKDDFIMENLKQLFKSGAIWIESDGMKIVKDFEKYYIKENLKFNFQGLDKINELEDTIERLKCCGNCRYEAFDSDCHYCGYFEDTRNMQVCKRQQFDDNQNSTNPDLWQESSCPKGAL